MRRADRLFQLIQLLRSGRVVTAGEMAKELEVSERTVYRDIVDLRSSGVPIEGEAGVGYALPRGFDLPPLMFTEEELETLVLGARMAEAWGGSAFARRARSILSKVEAVLPARLRGRLDDVNLFAPGYFVPERLTANLEPLRTAISKKHPVSFRYVDRGGSDSLRSVRPLGLYYWGWRWTLAAWCELRQDFRNFRPDRMAEIEIGAEPYPQEPGRDLDTFLNKFQDERDG